MTIKTFTAQHGQVWESVEGLEQTSIIRMHPVKSVALDDAVDPDRIPHGLKIQVIDAYSYQRELSISRHQHYSMVTEQVGTMTTQRDGGFADGTPFEPVTGVPIMGEPRMVNDGIVWVVSAYKHPFRPAVEMVVSEKVAMRLIDRIWKLATEYPILMFNTTNEFHGGKSRDIATGPRCTGFVHFHDQLLAGATPSVKLLP